MSIEQDIFADISKAFEAKADGDLLKRARTLQEYMDLPYLEEEAEARRHIVDEEIARLDDRCEFMGEEVLVSGRLLCGSYNEVTEEDEANFIIVDDMKLISHGFSWMRYGEGDDYRDRVGYLFRLPETYYPKSDTLMTQTTKFYTAFGELDHVSVTTSSPDRDGVIGDLESMIPEIVDDIDNAITGADSPLSAVLRLRGLSVDPQHLPSDVIRNLLAYVGRTIDMNGGELFELSLKNLVAVEYGNSDSLQFMAHDARHPGGGNNKVLANFKGVVLVPQASCVNGRAYFTNDLHWHVSIDILKDKNGIFSHADKQQVLVSVADIVDAQSVHDLVSDSW